MPKKLPIHFLLLLVLVSTGAVLAASKSSSRVSVLYGEIASADATAQTLIVRHGNDTSTFKTDAATKYQDRNKQIEFSDLQVGDEVKVSFTKEGDEKVAIRIVIAHANPCKRYPRLPQCPKQ